MEIELKELKLEHIHMHLDHMPPALGHRHGDERLLESIATFGILTPLVVMREATDCYRIVDGHRRYWAANRLNHKSVVCSIVPERLGDGDYELLRFQLYATTKPWSKEERQKAWNSLKSASAKAR